MNSSVSVETHDSATRKRRCGADTTAHEPIQKTRNNPNGTKTPLRLAFATWELLQIMTLSKTLDDGMMNLSDETEHGQRYDLTYLKKEVWKFLRVVPDQICLWQVPIPYSYSYAFCEFNENNRNIPKQRGDELFLSIGNKKDGDSVWVIHNLSLHRLNFRLIHGIVADDGRMRKIKILESFSLKDVLKYFIVNEEFWKEETNSDYLVSCNNEDPDEDDPVELLQGECFAFCGLGMLDSCRIQSCYFFKENKDWYSFAKVRGNTMRSDPIMVLAKVPSELLPRVVVPSSGRSGGTNNNEGETAADDSQ